MLNKIQSNVNQMVSQAKKITRQRHHSHSRKRTMEVNNYVEHAYSVHLNIASSQKNINLLKQIKKRSVTHNQNQQLLKQSDKRFKTQNVYSAAKYRLQPCSQQKHVLALEPNQTELLSTKIFGLNKPKYLRREKQCKLPNIKATKQLHSYNKTQFNLQEHLNEIHSMKNAQAVIRSKIDEIYNFYPEQSLLQFRQKKKRSLSKYLKHANGSKSNLSQIPKPLFEVYQLQPWQSEANQNFQASR